MASRARRTLWLLPLGALGLGAALLLAPPGGLRVTIVGDGAAAVTRAFAPMRPGIEPAVGAVDAVLLRRAENLRHLPDVARLCRGRCTAALTVLHELRPRGGRKVLVFDLSQAGGAAALDRGDPLPKGTAACIARVIAAEAAQRGPAPPAPCTPERRWRAVLPYGL